MHPATNKMRKKPCAFFAVVCLVSILGVRSFKSEHEKYSHVVLTSWFNFANDPQRGSRVSVDTIDYMYNLYVTATHLRVPVVVFHNAVPDSLVATYSNQWVTFIKVVPDPRYSTNDARFLMYDTYVRTHNVSSLMMVDASDVFFNSDPFKYIHSHKEHELFMAPDIGTFHDMAWGVQKCFDGPKNWDQSMKMHNAGVWGGRAEAVGCVLQCIVQQLTGPMRGKGNCNMPALNWCVSHGPCATASLIDDDPAFVNRFRKDCNGNHSIIHNKCSATEGKICVEIVKEKIQLRQKEGACSNNQQWGARTAPLVHLVYAADRSALPGVIASIKSVRSSASQPVAIHFIGEDSIPDVDFISLESVRQTFDLQRFFNPKLTSSGSPGLNSPANYIRFVMGDLFPTVSKVMWIDADTIVNCDVVAMVQAALTTTNHAVAAVPRHGRPAGISKTFKTSISTTFNAGVLVVDLDRWRERNLTDQVAVWARRNRDEQIYTFGSQPPLALAIGENFEHLDLKWNVGTLGYVPNFHSAADVCILHWTGKHKHWLKDGLNKDKLPEHAKYEKTQAAKLDKNYASITKWDKLVESEIVYRFQIAVPPVLCVGARLGGEVRAFKRVTGSSNVVGIDFNPGINNPDVVYGDAMNLQFEDNSFETLYTNILDHIPNLDKAFSEFKRVLRPGGVVLIDIDQNQPDAYAVRNLVKDLSKIEAALQSYFGKSISRKIISDVPKDPGKVALQFRNPVMPYRVLVTGGAGFIGMHTCLRLQATGHYVVAYDNLNTYYDPSLKAARVRELRDHNVPFVHADVCNSTALSNVLVHHRIDRVLHLAAQAGVRYSLDHPHEYVHNNINCFVTLLEAIKTKNIPLVYASSSSVYGTNKKVPFAESDKVENPASLYAATKRADELIAKVYHNLHAVESIGLRFFTVYGPWGRPDMAYWSFTENILSGVPIRLFNHGKMGRDFTYIDDIVGGIVAALGTRTSSPLILNLGSHRPVPLNRFVHTIETKLGKKALIESVGMQPGDVPRTYADLTLSKELLGYNPTTTLEEGISRFIDWYKTRYPT